MVSKKSKLIFLMPPKTASNSLKECLLDSSIDFDEFPNDYKMPKIHLFLSELIQVFDIQDWQDYKIVQIVRNPNTRFVSSYFHQLKIIPNTAKDVRIRGLDFSNFAHHFYDSLTGNDFFEDFYGNYNFVQNAIIQGKSWGGSRTYLNQLQWNDMKANVIYIKLEELSDDISILSDHLGVYLPELEKKNENKIKTDYMSMITPDVQQIIDDVYYYDFTAFKY